MIVPGIAAGLAHAADTGDALSFAVGPSCGAVGFLAASIASRASSSLSRPTRNRSRMTPISTAMGRNGTVVSASKAARLRGRHDGGERREEERDVPGACCSSRAEWQPPSTCEDADPTTNEPQHPSLLQHGPA